jgi:hypothetical protein
MAPKTISVVDDVEFNALVQALARDVVDAHIYWGQHTALQAQLEKWPEVQAEGWSFWYYTLQAHQRTALASLARVFDQEPNSLHLRSWLVSIRDHTHLFGKDAAKLRRPGDPFVQWLPENSVPNPAQLNQDIELCSKQDPDVKALIKYRHTVLAHRGAELSKQGATAKLPELLFEQIERLLARARDILNRYNYMFDASFFGMTPLGHDAVEHVFEGMQRDLDRQKAIVAAQVAAVESRQLDFETQIQRINESSQGRELETGQERQALAKRFGYTIDDLGRITGVVLWRNGESPGS